MVRKLLIIFLCFSANIGLGQLKIYTSENTLSLQFINEICNAARNKEGEGKLGASQLEKLISEAAGTFYTDSLQPILSFKWHKKYASQCICEKTEEYERGDILRQIVQSNFRKFANLVGPNNRLALDISFKDPVDSLTIREYVNQKRIALERKHHDRRFEFQQDEEWRNIMFFYFIFSEFSIN